MRVNQRKDGSTRYTFDRPGEGLIAIATMNERHFCYAAAAKLYREAAEVVPEAERGALLQSAERCDRLAPKDPR